jgi:hypothetical protein
MKNEHLEKRSRHGTKISRKVFDQQQMKTKHKIKVPCRNGTEGQV